MLEKIQKIPFTLVFFAYLGYLGVELYDFYYSPDGQVEKHRLMMTSGQSELDAQKKKLAEGKKFVKTVEAKKQDIRDQIKRLADYKGALSETLDVPSMMKTLFTEAKKLELKVDRLEPSKKTPKEYYVEQDFRLEIRGTYQQIAIFTQRVAQMERILRIENYSIKPAPSNMPSRVSNQLAAQLFVRAYQYTVSKEDKITVSKDEKPAATGGKI